MSDTEVTAAITVEGIGAVKPVPVDEAWPQIFGDQWDEEASP